MGLSQSELDRRALEDPEGRLNRIKAEIARDMEKGDPTDARIFSPPGGPVGQGEIEVQAVPSRAAAGEGRHIPIFDRLRDGISRLFTPSRAS